MVVNMNMRGNKEGNINQYLADTIASVFNTVATVDVERSTNRELFASDNTEMFESLHENINLLTPGELKEMMEKVDEHCVPYDAGQYIMTDDQAPVELLGMQVIDDLIQDEVSYYKEIYKEKGLKGVWESF